MSCKNGKYKNPIPKRTIIPERSLGEENPLVQLAIHNTHIPLYRSQ
jgi:hypothetical protein